MREIVHEIYILRSKFSCQPPKPPDYTSCAVKPASQIFRSITNVDSQSLRWIGLTAGLTSFLVQRTPTSSPAVIPTSRREHFRAVFIIFCAKVHSAPPYLTRMQTLRNRPLHLSSKQSIISSSPSSHSPPINEVLHHIRSQYKSKHAFSPSP